jgi:protease IV
MTTVYDYLKNIFLFLLLLQFAPPLLNAIKKQYASYIQPKTKIGVVPIKGNLDDSSAYVGTLKKFFQDPEIKALVLKIECPGGSPGTSQAIFNEITHLKKYYKKTIITYAENVCASGGYYIAAATDHIICPASACIGNIGVVIRKPYLKELAQFVKFRYDIIKSGEFKTIGDPFQDTTAAEQQLLQNLATDSYNQFLKDVSTCRPKLILKDAATWANGIIFTGQQALGKGLVDELGSQSTVEQTIRRLVPIEYEIEWVKPSHPVTFLSLLTGPSGDEDGDNSLFSLLFKNATEYIMRTTQCVPHF